MRVSLAALVLALLALGASEGLLRPQAQALEAAERAYEGARLHRNALSARVHALEGAESRRKAKGPEDVLPVRRAVVACLEKSSVQGVKIDVRSNTAGTAIALSGRGLLGEDLRLMTALLGPQARVNPLRVHLSPGDGDVAFTFEGGLPP
jgi:hypothetical protein